jgi:phosphomannomutase
MSLEPAIQKRIDAWLTGPYDEETKQTIRTLMKSDPNGLRDAFYTDLDFGTGGLRGIMGVGTCRMNRYTVRIATQGLANYILKQKIAHPRVVIGYDSRHHSLEFAQDTASVLAAAGIEVLLLSDIRPTPYVSFAVREKKCTAGVMITASHNPKEYNGYKVFWSDGGQVVPPHDTGIMLEVHRIKGIEQVRLDPDSPLIKRVDPKLDQVYLDVIRPLQHYPEKNKAAGHTLSIAYTSLHGTGIKIAPLALRDWGFTSLHFVEKQIVPDGDFPTVKFPNPEYPETLALGIETMLKTGSDLLIATDPDADRMAAVIHHKGKAVILSGNEIAALLADYLFRTLTTLGTLPKNGAIVTTIVTTELLKKIATAYKRPCFEVLTGFKYIGEKIHQWENGSHTFLFGAEESYGYLNGTHARDKDAPAAACLFAEMALQAKLSGKTCVDLLEAIYKTYGHYREAQHTLNFSAGEKGNQEREAFMQKLRQTPPKLPIQVIEDYETKIRTTVATGKKEPLDLPESNVLVYHLVDGSRYVIRPSGTEPKIKIYGSVSLATDEKMKETLSIIASL